MKRIIRLTESHLYNIINEVIEEMKPAKYTAAINGAEGRDQDIRAIELRDMARNILKKQFPDANATFEHDYNFDTKRYEPIITLYGPDGRLVGKIDANGIKKLEGLSFTNDETNRVQRTLDRREANQRAELAQLIFPEKGYDKNTFIR